MNPIVFHVASGDAFFTGISLVIAATLFSTKPAPWAKRISLICFLVGAIATAVSSTPIPYWYYGFAALVTLVWLLSCTSKERPNWPAYIAAFVWIGAGALELPYRFTSRLDEVPSRTIAVIGDSLTAGLDDGTKTWPRILADRHRISMQDFSHVGETASSAVRRIQDKTISAPLVIVEIGGNDLLGSTTAEQFEKDLGQLLGHLAPESSDVQVVMIELPLPPFYHEFGRIQ